MRSSMLNSLSRAVAALFLFGLLVVIAVVVGSVVITFPSFWLLAYAAFAAVAALLIAIVAATIFSRYRK